MTSEITEEMVERLVEQAAHLELGIACRGPDVSNAARELLSQLNAVLPGLRALAARPIEAGSVKIQRYELTPHGTLKEAADGWWTSADAAEAAIAEREERIEQLDENYTRAWNERDAQRRRAEAAEARFKRSEAHKSKMTIAIGEAIHILRHNLGRQDEKVRDVEPLLRAALQQEGESDV